MSRSRIPVWRTLPMHALIVAAFLSSGAWMVMGLPPIPIAKALQLATVAAWLLAFGLGAVRIEALDRRVAIGAAAVLGAVVLSWLAAGSLLPVAVYDLFGDMPLVQWLAFPAVFTLAATLRLERQKLTSALAVIVGLGTLLAFVMAYQQRTTGANHVFGSTAYSITALVPLIPIGVGLGASTRGAGKVAAYVASALIAASLAFASGSLTGAAAAGFAVLLAIGVAAAGLVKPAVHLSAVGGTSSGRGKGTGAEAGRRAVGRAVTWIAGGLAAVLVAGVLFAQIPALSGTWVNADRLQPYGKNVLARVYLWQGAQDMFAARPLLGYGPSGYRAAAVEHLDPRALQYGADVAGNIDPTVYSPQSPHSLLWEIATRLGVVGLLAFAALLAAWCAALFRPREPGEPGDTLRWGLAAGFVAAVFAMLVNPVIFAIGLFAPLAAGLAVGPTFASRKKPVAAASVRGPLKPALAVAGAVVLLLALWLGIGEWRGYTASSDDPSASAANYEATLRILPGQPFALRRLLDTRLLLAADAPAEAAAQTAVDESPEWMRQYGPNLVNFAAYSLSQAQATGRTDVSWERGMLSSAEERLPEIPSLVSEELHLAVVSGDPAAVRAALPAAHRWGRPYPLVEDYIRQAEALLQAKSE